jgi:Serine hydroxymethyltransferase
VQVKANAAACAARLVEHGYELCTGGTENHLLLWDLRPQVSYNIKHHCSGICHIVKVQCLCVDALAAYWLVAFALHSVRVHHCAAARKCAGGHCCVRWCASHHCIGMFTCVILSTLNLVSLLLLPTVDNVTAGLDWQQDGEDL